MYIPTTALTAGGAGGLTVVHDEMLGAPGSFDVSGIPGGLGTLLCILHAKGTTTQQNLLCRFNNDSGANYSGQIMTASGGTVAANGGTAGQTSMHIGYVIDTGTPGNAMSCVFEIPNYDSTTFDKYITARDSIDLAAGAFYYVAASGAWHSTAAVTRVALLAGGGSLDTGSRLTIYGLGM
jgi:hypothetical protein